MMLTTIHTSRFLANAAVAALVPCRLNPVVDERRSGYFPALAGRHAS
jgi:hypothetical protein